MLKTCLVLGLFLVSQVVVTGMSLIKTESVQWEIVDIPFEVKKTPEHPFSVDFGAIFSGPDNQSMKVPGFFNGNGTWLLRFSSGIAGDWTYETFSDLNSLDGKKGKLTVRVNPDTDRHGGIEIHPQKPQHFTYEDGTPYLCMAFECDWLFALDYENKDDAPKTRHFLSLLEENGINQIVTTVYSYDVSWKKDEKLKDHPEHEYGGRLNIYPFLGTNEDPDFSALNVDFFKQFDRTVSLMNDHGMAAHLMIYVWNKMVNWPGPETEADNMYFDYIVKRYQAYPNVIWDVSKEALNNPRCTEAYGVERIKRIRKLDAFKRLITVHDYGFCARNTEHVDFISIQNWTSTLYTEMLEIREKYPAYPIFNIEHGGYESSYYEVFPGDYSNPDVCLRRNYLCSFAGTYHTYYWQGAAWNVIIPDPFEQDQSHPQPKFAYYKHLVDFFTTYPFNEFEPARENNHSGYCLKNKEGVYLIYIPKENEKLSAYGKSPLAKKEGTVRWFNTLTGEYSEEQMFEGGMFISPWRGEADAILIRNTQTN